MIEPTNPRAITTGESTINAKSCRSLFHKCLVLVAALFSVASFSAHAANPVVNTVPWVPADPLIPHETWSGKEITVKAAADVEGSNYSYSWDFGDGSPVETGTVTDRYAIDARHTYTGTPGDVFTARLTIENTATGETGSDTYFVQIREKTLETEVNVAIDEGLWYLHRWQTRTTENNVDYGDWRTRTGCSACSSWFAITAANINAFATQGHAEASAADNPYTETVQRAMRSLMTYLRTEAISNRTYPDIGTVNPDSNGNGLGVRVNQSTYPYQGGLFIDAIVAAGEPDTLASTGPTGIIGRSYADIVQDMVDSYAFGQYNSGSNRGGWRYAWNQGPDNSAAQWGAIGLIPAERLWGLTVPDWVKSQNEVWLAFSQTTSGAEAGRFGYTNTSPSSWGPYAVTPSGMVQMVMDGIGRGDSRWDASETWIRDRFANTCSSTNLQVCARAAIKDNYYGMFSFVKSMRLHEPAIELLQSQTAGVQPLDWYAAELSGGDVTNGVARTLVDDQQADGRWTGNYYESRQQPFDTPWAIIMLGQTLFEAGSPVAVAQAAPNPGIAGQSISLNGTGSFHQDPERTIVGWEWDLDNDGTFESPGVSVATSFPALGDYPVNLRVTDDSISPRTAETTVIVRITLPPLPPTADAGGPYSFCPDQSWFLDGTGSINPDEGQSEPGAPGDTIQQFAWDLDGDGSFDDTFGSQPDVNGYFGAQGVGDYLVNLQVTDTTSISYPSSGQPDLTDTDAAQVRVRDAADAACTCIADLTARPKSGKVQLVWTDTGATLYNVYRGTTAGGPYQFLVATDSRYSTYLDLTVVNDTQYYYVVRETLPNGAERCQSIEATATPAARRRSSNNAPVIVSAAPTAAVAQMVYSYDVDAVDGDGDVLTFSLDLAPTGMTIDALSGLIEWTPVLAQVGTQNVAVRVIDPAGAADTQTWQIVVSDINAPPAIVSSPVVDATEGDLYTYDVDAVDPNAGDVLTYSLDVAPTGMTVDPVSGLIQWTPLAAQVGTAAVTVRATDPGGLFGSQAYTILVDAGNAAPAITSVPVTTATEGDLYTYDVEANDPDGDTLTFSLDVAPTGMTIDETSGLIQWTPAAGQAGTAAVTVRATDPGGLFGSQAYTILVDAGNAAPAITSVPVTTATEGDLYTYDVEANDPDGDTLTFSLDVAPTGMTIDETSGLIQWTPAAGQAGTAAVTVRATDPGGLFGSQAYTILVDAGNAAPAITSVPVTTATEGDLYTYDVEANDPDGDTLTFSLDVAPTGMTIDETSGLIQWTPAAGQAGTAAVTVRATDPGGLFGSQAYTILVDAGNAAPAITSVPVTTATEGDLYTYDVEANDPDGDTLTFSLDVAPTGMTIDETSGLIQWTPAAGQAGTAAVTVRATDPGGLFGSQAYTILVDAGNAAPAITSVPVTTATEDQLYTYDVEATDPDAGDTLTFSLDVAPASMSIDPASGLIQWTPIGTQLGDNLATVRVADGNGGFATQAYTITVSAPANQPPSITSVPVTTGTEGQLYTYDVEANDPDGDTLTFSLDVAPTGMTIDETSGLIQWTPAAGQAGTAAVTVRATDPGGLFGSQAYTILVDAGNAAPAITSVPVTTATEGDLYTYDVEATDPDAGDTLTFSLDVAPAGMSIDPASGLIQWTPIGTQLGANAVTVRVADPGGLFATQAYTIDVAAATADDFLRPEVTLIVAPGVNVNVNDITTLQVTATDDTAVASTALTINGANVPLNAAGIATFTSATAGIFDVLATAVDPSGNEGAATATLRFLESGDVTPPTAVITVPANDAGIASPIDVIGTATDDTALLQYRLQAARAGTSDFFVIDTGNTPVVNGVLGQLDPSLLKNGIYTLRLVVEDTAGNTATVQTSVQVEGDLKVGNFSLTIDDLSIPVAGIPIVVSRTYDSRNQATGDFGAGWTLGISDFTVDENVVPGFGWEIVCIRQIFGTCLEWSIDPSVDHRVVITRPDGAQDEFRVDDNTTFAQPSGLVQGTLVFPPLPGTSSTLQALNDTVFDFLLGGELLDTLFNTLDPSRYRLTDLDGTAFVFNQFAGIESVTDRNGNTITFGPGGIIHSAGKSVVYTRDGQGRITGITDPNGNTIGYEYDFYGDLVASTDAEGNTTRYRYNNSHGLLEIIDPLGRGVARNEYDDEGRLVATVDADGNRVEYTRDIDARQEVVRDRLGNVTVFGYDDSGNITAQTDALGNTTAFTYDADGNQLSQTDPLGNVSTRTYDANDNPLSETDPLGNTTNYTYNASGDPLTITDPRGNTYARTYDASGNLLSETDANGNVTTNSYDAGGNVLTTTDPLGTTSAFTYDGAGNETTTTDPLGNVTTYTYDANGNQLTETRTRSLPAGGTETLVTTREYDALNRLIRVTDPLGNMRDNVYDANGNVVAEIDALGRAINYAYDARGNRVQTTYPDGTTQQLVYDAENRPVASTDRQGRTTQLEYDALGRLTRTTFPDGARITETYDAAGRRISSTGERGNVTSYEYDAAGHHVRTIDALGNVITIEYDAVGNQTASTDPLGRRTEFAYDANDQLTTTTFPDGTTATVTYDAVGRRISETDQLGQTTTFAYDVAGRLTSTTDALGNTTTFTYDELGNKLTQTDANGNTESWTYDALGRVETHTLPLGQTEQFTYDAVGNVITHQDFNGDTTTYIYDVNDRAISQTFEDLSTDAFTYFDSGLIATATDARGATQFQYDLRDRLLQKTLPDGQVLSYTYDAVGNRLTVTTSAGTTTHVYDALNRLSTVTDAGGGVSTYTYDATGNRATLTYPNGNVARYTYNTLNRLTNISNETGTGAVLSSYAYTLAPDGKRTRVIEADGRQVDYAYDAVSRLVQETITEPGPTVTVIDYTYDAVGNRLTRNAGGAVTAYTYDGNDRLLSDDTSDYTYDDNGNLLTRTSGTAVTTYSWSFENELVAVSAPLETTEFEYDELGNRVVRRINGVTSRFLVDTNRQLSRVIAELDAAGAAIVAYSVGDDLISQTRAGVDSYYLYDGNASTRQLTDGTGAVSDAFDYDAFGNLLARTGTTDNEFLYVGEQLDANIGFYYLRARYMDPSVGRFISRDPFVGNSFDPASLHKYSYAMNNPVSVMDPTGRFGIASIGFNFSIRSILITAAVSAPFRILEAAKDLSEGASLGAVTLNLVSGIGFDVAVGGAVGNLYRFAKSIVAVRAASQSVSAFRAARASGSVWNKLPFARGWEVEKRILGVRKLADNFPVIDAWNKWRGVATSIKSLDLTATSYQTASRLRSAITRSARSLANFRGASIGADAVDQLDIKKRVLVYAFEQGAVTRAQSRALREIARELKRDLDIDLVFQWIP